MSSSPVNPLTLNVEALPIPNWAKRLLSPFTESLAHFLGFATLSRMYEKLRGEPDCDLFVQNVLQTLNVDYKIAYGGTEHIPPRGPVIVVANHPFGGLEGVVLAQALRAVRPDVKLWANYLLARFPEVRDLFIFVDPFGGKASKKRNILSLRETIDYLNAGGLLCVFPSGTVSHLQLRRFEISDPEWSLLVARIIRITNATVVPIYFHGTNSTFFQLSGLLHPSLRTALLPREFLNKKGSPIIFRIGKPISPERLSAFLDDREMLAYLRFRTYLLRTKVSHDAERVSRPAPPVNLKLKPIVPAEDPALIEKEIQAIPAEQILVEAKQYIAFYATAAQIPYTLREIGRLRELTFREVQEGTGKSIDIDRFDNYYLHLFTWNQKKQEIVGSYRMGRTDKIVERYGVQGLYTNTLFHYTKELLDQLGPSLELGRSFVRAEYQRNYFSLFLLWRGIATFVAKNPQYRNLFGPVSINNEYHSISQELIVAFLKANNFHPDLTRLVRPRNPMRTRPRSEIDPHTVSVVVKDLQEVSELIAEIEAREHSVPVLLRHYLRLGGKLLGFNIDFDFGSVLDGLILVDMSETDRRLLNLYMGKDGAEGFLRFHQSKSAVSPSKPQHSSRL